MGSDKSRTRDPRATMVPGGVTASHQGTPERNQTALRSAVAYPTRRPAPRGATVWTTGGPSALRQAMAGEFRSRNPLSSVTSESTSHRGGDEDRSDTCPWDHGNPCKGHHRSDARSRDTRICKWPFDRHPMTGHACPRRRIRRAPGAMTEYFSNVKDLLVRVSSQGKRNLVGVSISQRHQCNCRQHDPLGIS